MLFIYSNTVTERLRYICSFLFGELMPIDYQLTTDTEKFIRHEGPKINYSAETLSDVALHIQPVSLLFEQNIISHPIECREFSGMKIFFSSSSVDIPFDIFAASFYLLSRYEEYLPHPKDEYGRFAHTHSVAFQYDFLQRPMVNLWADHFADALKKKFPELNIQFPAFEFIPTYDIDIAFSFHGKGFFRNFGGFLKRPSLLRLKVLLSLHKDPFDCFGRLDELHRTFGLSPIYFLLMARRNGKFDKNILPARKRMQMLIRDLSQKYTLGAHPSWASGEDGKELSRERELLEEIAGKKISRSRQHYIRFNLPEEFRKLIAAGITDDYSMGYGSINGFRASVAQPFYWFDLGRNETTALKLHPFCFMEANAFYEQKLTVGQAYDELMRYLNLCKNHHGQLITVWHNHLLGDDPLYAGWRSMYEQFLRNLNA